MIEPGVLLHDRYQVRDRLGAGGMGEVYLALDQSNGQLVAVKRLLLGQENVDQPLLERRFQEEIHILQRLNFPGIPAFIETFCDEGQSFLVMEFIQGYSLDKMLQISLADGEGLTAEQVATVALHISRVLEYLHSQVPPLVHRDIKPSNLIIRESDQRIFLVDFGLAREIRSNSSAKTQIGTWCYAPVEQIRGHVEPRSDFYSLGVTMLELLCGQVPAALSIPPARKLMPDLSQALARIIDLCTKAEVTQRYSEACLLRQDLEDVLAKLAGQAEQPGPTEEDKVSELVRRWGKGRAASQGAVPTAPVLSDPVLPAGASPAVRKAVDRARRRVQEARPEAAHRRRLWLTVGLIFGLLGLGLWQLWTVYPARQLALVAQSFPAGGPGPGWKCSDARGLFAADGVGLGRGPLDPGFPLSGVVFRRAESLQAHELSFHFKPLQGKPEVLVFMGPVGISVRPSGDVYQAEVIKIAPMDRVMTPVYRGLGHRVTLERSGSLALTATPGHFVLSRDGSEIGRLPRPNGLEWRGEACGILQLGQHWELRSLVSRFVVR